MDYSQMKPIKKAEQTHIQRQFLRWSKYWQACTDKQKKAQYMNQLVKLSYMFEKELTKRERQ